MVLDHHEYNHEKHVRQVQTEENPKIPDQLSLNIIKSSKTKKEAATAKSSLEELQQKHATWCHEGNPVTGIRTTPNLSKSEQSMTLVNDHVSILVH